jgi:KR domain
MPRIVLQANYAAANAALDAYAAQQVARGTAAVAVQWGAWSSVGEARRYPGYSMASPQSVTGASTRQHLQLLTRLIRDWHAAPFVRLRFMPSKHSCQ